MSVHQKTLPQLVSWRDRNTDEYAAARAFLKSAYVERIFYNTFKDTAFEYHDLDGLARPTTPTPSRVKPSSPPSEHASVQTEPSSPLELLFSLEECTLLAPTFVNSWFSVSPLPNCCSCGHDRSACQLHRRKLSRSSRISEINIILREAEVVDPFVATPDLQENDTFNARCTKSRSQAFTLLDLPGANVDENCVDEGPDPPAATISPPL